MKECCYCNVCLFHEEGIICRNAKDLILLLFNPKILFNWKFVVGFFIAFFKINSLNSSFEKKMFECVKLCELKFICVYLAVIYDTHAMCVFYIS